MFIRFWNYARSIVFTCKSVSKTSCTFITVITQIRTFFLNLGSSHKNFETTNYCQDRISKGKTFSKFFRKTMRSNLNTSTGVNWYQYTHTDVLVSINTSRYIAELCSFSIFFFFLYLGFLSQTLTIHRTAGERGGYLINFSLPLPPAWRARTY